ncbi:hypothetical protein [Bacillus amyloliquefaciens]|uniref:hypothetical protein n=1 Tax=Bacillus amyloliquefaciens TaxID=1390 RepID=UPI00397B55CA
MKRYAAERFIQMLVILFGTSFIIFFLFAMLPGDYIDSNVNLTPERAQELKARELGENPPYILIHYRQSARAVSGKIKGLEPDNYSGINSSLSNVSIQ